MDSEDDSPVSKAEDSEWLGSDAFDWDFQYSQSAPIFRIFGHDPPPDSGPLRTVSQFELDWILFRARLISDTLHYAGHSIWQSLLCRLLVRLLSSDLCIPFLNWRWKATKISVVPVQICLLLCIHRTCCKDLAKGILQCLTRRGNLGNETFTGAISLLSYCMGSLVCHNIGPILRMSFKPKLLLLIGLLSLYAAGLLQSVARHCKLVLSAIRDRIWLAASQSGRQFRIAYQTYTRYNPERDATSHYKYTKVAPSEIRLVELRRSYFFARITVRLLVYPLLIAPPYEALSYTWDNVTTNHSILLAGDLLPVTHSAFEALQALAPFWGRRVIWIDSICINQRDPQDKNQQVALMAKIYRQATRTIAWLGDSPNADIAILQLGRLQNFLSTNPTREKITEEAQQSVFNLDNPQHWNAVSELLAHPYWARVWIVQELAVSKNVSIIYGTRRIPLASIFEVVDRLWATSGGDDLMEKPWKLGAIDKGMLLNYLNIRVISGFRRLIQQDQYPDLRETVEATFFFKATDPRDKIYAFCGIANYSADAHLDPDYTTSVKELYFRFTATYIRDHFQETFFMAGLSQPRQLPDLPSWVPDFTGTDDDLNIPQSRAGPQLERPYSACGEELTVLEISPGNRLRLRGVIVDQIEHLTSSAFKRSWEDTYDKFYSPALYSWHGEAESLVLKRIPQKYRCYEESRRQAFVRTLIGDRSSDGSAATVVYRTYYKEWRQRLKMAAESGFAPVKILDSGETLGAKSFSSAFREVAQYRKLAVTAGGYLALVANEARVSDVICVIFGLNVPFVLRPVHMDLSSIEDREYELVGWCYCHGIMMGEALETGQAPQTIVVQ